MNSLFVPITDMELMLGSAVARAEDCVMACVSLVITVITEICTVLYCAVLYCSVLCVTCYHSNYRDLDAWTVTGHLTTADTIRL